MTQCQRDPAYLSVHRTSNTVIHMVYCGVVDIKCERDEQTER